jgi:hypothetical protein
MNTIGGTMVARILGLSRWGGPLSAYFELRGEPDTTPRNTAMDRGNALEESVLNIWGAIAGAAWERGNQISSAAIPHAHATVDAIGLPDGSDDRFILDAKTASRETMTSGWGADGTDRIPVEYQLQLLWYMMVAKAAGMNVADEALLPTLVGPEAELQWAARLVQRTGKPIVLADLAGTGLEFRVYRVAWDAKLAEEVNARVLRFIREHVEPGIPPEPGDGDLLTDRDVRAVARGQRAEKGRVVDFDALAPPEQSAILEIVEASRQRKSWEAAEEQARARVQVLMGGIEEVAGCPGGARVCWREMSSGARRFEVKEPKEGR